jgi:anti-sigma factor RsiW
MQDDHKHLHELISALADGTLTPEEAAQIQVHMKDCPDCRQLLHDIRRIGTAVGEEGVPPVPTYLAGRIRERIAGGAGESLAVAPAVPIWRSPFPLATAATLLLMSVIWLAWPRGASRSTPISQDAAQQAPAASESARAKQALPSTAQNAPVKPNLSQPPASEPLRKLGYLVDGGSKESIPSARADSVETESGAMKEKSLAPKDEPSRGLRSEDLDRITSSSLTGDDYKKAQSRSRAAANEEAKEAPRAAPQASAPGFATTVADIRSLDYEGPAYSATFAKDGLITVVARGYACSADVPVSKPGASEGEKAERVRSIEDLLSFFAAAGSRDFLAASTPGVSGGVEANQNGAGPSSLTLRDGDGNPIRTVNFSDPLPEDAPKTLRGLRQAIGHLVKDRYRSEIEARCGPLPQSILDSP